MYQAWVRCGGDWYMVGFFDSIEQAKFAVKVCDEERRFKAQVLDSKIVPVPVIR